MKKILKKFVIFLCKFGNFNVFAVVKSLLEFTIYAIVIILWLKFGALFVDFKEAGWLVYKRRRAV